MAETTDGTLLEAAEQATARGAWGEAFHLLTDADARGLLDRAGLALLAQVAYPAGHLDATIDAWERLHAACVEAGDRLGAAGAAVRLAMHLLFDTALLAPVRGWIKRAEQLLEGSGPTPVHAWLAVVRNYERLLSGDFEEARRYARQAVEVGAAHDPAAAAIGRVAEARSLVLEGRVAEGLSLLDEAGAAAVSGELDPLSTGIVYCELVCGLQGLAQYDLAEQWTDAMERWRRGAAVGSLPGRCRVHRAEILCLRGECREAEAAALAACEELRPYLRRELGWPLSELGRIRLRLGDRSGAEAAFLAAHDAGWDPQPGLALLRLEQGDVEAAAVAIRDALEHPLDVPSKELPPNTDLRRVPLLDAQVEIAVAAGDLDRARAAAHELGELAERFGSTAFEATAAVARARVALADGEAASGRSEFARAKSLWSQIGAPYEGAVAAMGLGHAHRAAGDEARATLEFRAAEAAFTRVGSAHLAEQAARALHEAAGARGRRPRHEVGGERVDEPATLKREGDTWLVEFDGATLRLRDAKGLRYLARLLSSPGREFHALDLVALERGDRPDGGRPTEDAVAGRLGDAGPLLDARAKEAYRRRLLEIDEDIEEARRLGDAARGARADAERAFLVRELARAVGLGGRDRRAGSASERARVSVTRALRHSMARVAAQHPGLGSHLDRTIRTGTYCAYLPDPRAPVAWRT